MKSKVIQQLENAGIITDMMTICPHCKKEVEPMMWQLGCCGESSDSFVEGYLFNDDTFMTEEQINKYFLSGDIH
jgi:hypothetical protein